MSLTGLPSFWEIRAASSGASKNSLRPKEPPPWITLKVTALCGRPSSAAISCSATMGDLQLAQMAAWLGWTSAIAALVSIGAWLAQAQSNSASTYWVNSGGTNRGRLAARSSAATVALDWLPAVPGPHVTTRASTASMHWPKVSAITATPVGICAAPMTPGMAPTAAAFCTDLTVPLMVGGRRTMVGMGTTPPRSAGARSRVYFLAPVTISRASTRFWGVPMRVYCDWA